MMTNFTPMRRKRQQLSEEEILQVIDRGTSGVLALYDASGYPYAVPISYAYKEGKFVFHSALKGHKIEALQHCPRASFCIVDQDDVKPNEYTTYFRSVIAFGNIRIIDDDAEKLFALRLLGERYSPNDEAGMQHEIDKDFRHLYMIELEVEHITGKEAIELVRAKNRINK